MSVSKTDADDVVVDGGSVAIRAAKSGTYSSTLSNGRTVCSEIREVPAAIDLTKTR